MWARVGQRRGKVVGGGGGGGENAPPRQLDRLIGDILQHCLVNDLDVVIAFSMGGRIQPCDQSADGFVVLAPVVAGEAPPCGNPRPAVSRSDGAQVVPPDGTSVQRPPAEHVV